MFQKIKFITCLMILLGLGKAFSQVTANQPPDLVVCEDIEYEFQSDGFEIVNLTVQDAVIIGEQTGLDVFYYVSQTDADAGTSPIVQPNNYLASTMQIFASAYNYSTGEYAVTSFNVVVTLPPFVYNTEFIFCDDDILDGITQFTFIDEYTYYRTQADAENQVNELPDTFSNLTPFYERIYRRLDFVNGCFDIGEVNLSVTVEPVLNLPMALESCGTNGTATFDLTIKEEEIKDNSRFYNIEYYYNETLITNPTEYVNTTNPQTIQVQVRGFDNLGCTNMVDLELIANEGSNPEVTNLPTQYFCPNDLGVFDLTSYEAQLVSDLTGLNFVYYSDYLEMLTSVNPIADPINYDMPLDGAIIYVKVEDVVSGCYTYSSINFNFLSNCQVSCNAPVNVTHCYGRGNKWFTFRSADGSPLTLRFNAGSIHVQDDILIKDADGTTLYNNSGNNVGDQFIYDLSGLTFQSSGDVIRMQIQSSNNSSNNCQESDGYTPWDFDVFCSDNVGIIDLQAFFDSNTNGIFDTNESVFDNGFFTYEANNDGIITTVVSSTGNHSIYSFNELDTFDVSYNLYAENENCFNITMPLVENISVLNGSTESVNFAVTEIETCYDIGVSLTNSSMPPRPGFNYFNWLTIDNLGAFIPSGSVEVILDDLLTLIYTSTGSNYSITNTSTGFILDFVNLSPNDSISVLINLKCSTSASLGDLVTNEVNYLTPENDSVEENNTFSLTQTVVNSYDPNNKYEAHGEDIVIDDFTADDYLYYTINFQNLGNAEAVNIKIEDILSQSLDKSTFRMVSSSHDYVVELKGNKLEWTFRNIYLPSENVDEPKSHGYVNFKIQPNQGYSVGNIIMNSASIYFDFNSPINTNTFITQFVAPLSVQAFDVTDFKMFPNPAKQVVTIKLASSNAGTGNVTIYNLQGKAILKPINFEGNSSVLDISSLESGLYFVELTIGNTATIQKLIVN